MLSGKAHEAELSSHLETLHGQFERWKSGQITVWDLSDLIHAFHDGDSRDLYTFYVYGKNYGYQVACAIKNGHLSMKDVEESCRDHIQYLLDKGAVGKMRELETTEEPIELYKILKFENMVNSGGEAKYVISEGQVTVNGEVETRKRKKIFSGDIIEFKDEKIRIKVK